jgi:hypothetical protein
MFVDVTIDVYGCDRAGRIRKRLDPGTGPIWLQGLRIGWQ